MPARIPEHELPRDARILMARRLHSSGLSRDAIADHLGVGRSTVFGYVHATPCPSCGGPVVSGSLCSHCTPRKAPVAGREEVLESLRKWHAQRGHVPSREEWRMVGARPTASTVQSHFGSWNDALLAAGLGVRRHAQWTRDDVVGAIQHGAVEHGGDPPEYADFRNARWPDPKTVATIFGSWRAAVSAVAS